MSVAKDLARYATQLSYKDLPKEVVHQAKRAILDSIGTMYFGSRWKEGKQVLKFAENLGAKPECTVVGANFKTSCPYAAFTNASFADVHDCNDGHRMGALAGAPHPGRLLVPTALAAGEKQSLSGEEVITSLVVGYDVMCRLAVASYRTKLKQLREKGERRPAYMIGYGRAGARAPPSGSYGAAAIAGHLLGLKEEEMINALGIAGYHHPGGFSPYPPLTSGYDVKFLNNGYLPKIGIEAALLAKEGLIGPPLSPELDAETATKGLGKKFWIMDIYIKAYPTCRNIQPPLDGVLDIRRRVNLKPSDVKEVVIRVADYAMGQSVHRSKPGSKYIVAQFDLPYCAACAIIDGEVEEKQFTADRIADPEVHKLADKIYVVLDNELNKLYPEKFRPAIVEVKTNDGKIHVSRIDYPKGDPRNTFTDDELFEKFKRWAGPSLSEEHMNKLRKSIFELEKFDDVSTFMENLSIK